MKKYYKVILALIVIIAITLGLIIFFNRPLLKVEKYNELQINSEYNEYQFIKNFYDTKEKDVQVESNVDIKKLGEYEVIYKVKDKEYIAYVDVVDNKDPEFDVEKGTFYVGDVVDPNKLVSNIKDDTKTQVSFAKEYDFSEVGNYEVTIQVEDEGENVSSKTTTIEIIEDTVKPVLQGVRNRSVYVGGNIDYLKNITASDNHDEEPKVSVDSSKVDLNKVGSYNVVYRVEDKAGNVNEYTAVIQVIQKESNQVVEGDENKTVYLTFDDGPSPMTEKVLDVLKRYNVKATFFVTGNNKNYNYLIKRAHDEGHTIGLHTYTHKWELYTSVDTYFDDLNKVGQMVKDIIGYVPKYIRFPGGSSNMISAKYNKGIMSVLTKEVINKGYQYYDWNVDSTDASGNNVAVSKLVANATSGRQNNIVLLMHDTGAKKTTVQALPQIIEYYQSKGYTFKGIDQTSFAPHHNVNN